MVDISGRLGVIALLRTNFPVCRWKAVRPVGVVMSSLSVLPSRTNLIRQGSFAIKRPNVATTVRKMPIVPIIASVEIVLVWDVHLTHTVHLS